MKRTIVLGWALLLISATCFSQKSTSFGIKAGVASNYLSYTYKSLWNQKVTANNTRPLVAGVAHVQFGNHFAIQPNLVFILKGGKLGQWKINTFHIELPVNFLYTNNGFFAGGGPNISYGLVGKINTSSEKQNLYEEAEAGDETLKRFDAGANVIVGYNFPNGLVVSANFTQGITDVYKGSVNGDETTTYFKYFAFSVGYMFGNRGTR